jgi:Fic family protein
MTFDPLKPYNDLPPLPPNSDIETRNILKNAIGTGRALAELKGLGEIIPNQDLLLNSLVLQEAKDSSESEQEVHDENGKKQESPGTIHRLELERFQEMGREQSRLPREKLSTGRSGVGPGDDGRRCTGCLDRGFTPLCRQSDRER